MIALLSPAKNLDFSLEDFPQESSSPRLVDERDYLLGKLKKLSAQKIGSMMKLSPKLADLNYERFQQFLDEDNAKKQAIYAFNGDVYLGFDASSLPAKDVNYAQDHVRILSGLYGLLRPLDLIEPYRLEMGTRWEIKKSTKNLYAYWGSKIASLLNEDAASHKDSTIINAASNEYFKSVDLKTLKHPVVNVNFKEEKNGEYKMIMVYAKKARGLMARFLVDNKIENAQDVKAFDSNGYTFNAAQSDDNNWIFTR